ncbi:MAG: glycosyltransferase [Ancalomicrobiaceae bacterium]|nr:glycosyltransferase [Ancalomicrobiaceae bacterium]
MTSAPIDLGIVICTYHRPQLLAATLSSLTAQEIPPGVSVTVHVVDNSDDGSAASTVAHVAEASPLTIRYVKAHPANISVARNTGIRASSEPYLAFIDDDEICAPGWIAAVATGLERFPHDVLFGKVVPDFEAPERASAAVRQLFSRELAGDAGLELQAYGSGKLGSITLATNNSIFRRATALIDDGTDPFDTAFGHGGGEDYDLFCRLQRRGCRFAWLPEAVVSEHVPLGRCDPEYLRRRFYAGGQAFAAALARSSARPGRARAILRLRALVQTALLALVAPVAALKGRDARLDHAYRLAGALGKLSFGSIYPIYRRSDPQARLADRG